MGSLHLKGKDFSCEAAVPGPMTITFKKQNRIALNLNLGHFSPLDLTLEVILSLRDLNVSVPSKSQSPQCGASRH